MSLKMTAGSQDGIVVGSPIPFSVYNADRKLLLAKGRIVDSERVRDILIQQGMYQANSSALELDETDVTDNDDTSQPCESPMEIFTREFHASTGQARVGVRVSREENGEGYPCWIIGADETHGLIVTAPTKPDRSLVPSAEGQMWTFRLMYLTAVVKFQATVRKVQFEPVPMLYVSAPKQVEMRNIRISPRVATCFRGSVDVGHPIPMLITDVSINGLRIAVERKQLELKPGQRLKLSFSVNVLGKDYSFKVPAMVIATRHEFDKRFPELQFVGVKIEAQSEMELLVLHSFVYEHTSTDYNSLWKTLLVSGAKQP
jgi:hypothetical protein